MKGNQINLKVLHFSERLLNDYYNLVQRGKVKMPEVSSGRYGSKRLNMDRSGANFMMTEEESSQKNELRALFEKTSTAKMTVEGYVVPNILF